MTTFYFDLKDISIKEASEKIKEAARTIEANPAQPLFILTEHVDMNGESLPYYSAFPYDREAVDQLADMINNPENAWEIYRKSISTIGSDVVARISRTKRPPKEQLERPEAWYVSKLALYNSAEGYKFREKILKNTVFYQVVEKLPYFSETQYHHGIFNAKFNGRFRDEETHYTGKEAGYYHFWKEIRDDLQKRKEFCFAKQFVCDGLSLEDKEFLIQTPCTIYALKQCGVNDSTLAQIIEGKMCYGNTIKTKDLKPLLFNFNYGLQIYSLNNNKQVVNIKHYPKDKEFTKIEVDVFQNHMMKHESHEITYIGSRNREFKVNVNFLQLLHWAFEEKFLVPMNCYEFATVLESRAFVNNYKTKTAEILDELIDYDPMVDCGLYSGHNKYSSQNIVFFDTECSTDEKYHKPYSLSYKINRHKIKHFFVENGKEVGEEFLKALQRHFLSEKKSYKQPVCVAYAHNLKYDIQPLIKHLTRISPPVIKGNKLYSLKGVFGKGKEKIMIEFRDTLPLLQMSLKKAGMAFLSEKQQKKIKKEAFPYNLYTFSFFEAHPSGWCTLDEFRAGFEDKKALEDFDNNIGNLSKKIYDPETQRVFYKEYCHFYCDQDVRILYKVMHAFDKFMTDTSDEENPFGDKFSPFSYLSISSLAYDFMIKNTVLNYEVVKIVKNTPIYDWVPKYPIQLYSRLIRYIGQQTIRGGRVMTRDNQMWHYQADPSNPKSLLVDYDAVSLYPSAISKLWMTEGVPKVVKGSFNEKDFLEKFTHPDSPKGEYKQYNDGWIHVYNLMCWKDRHFPLLCIKDEKTKLNDYQNFHGHVDAWVNAIDLFNLIEFQGATFNWDAAFVWEGERHYECRDVINRLFQIKAHAKNPMLRFLAKLMMNSIYGKSILKPTNYTTTIEDVHEWKYVGEDHVPQFERRNKWREFFNANAYRIKEFSYHPLDTEHITVKLHQLDTGYTNVLFGSNVLAMARRIVGRVISLAEDMEELHPECTPGIFYTDTDSMHIRIDLLEYTEQAYMEKYGLPIKGTEMCQFHIDFDPLSGNEKTFGADESWFLAKKMYADHLIGENGGEGYHQRMKGIPGDLIEWGHYQRLYNGDTIEYNLLANGHVSFVIENGTVASRLEMKREIKVKEAVENLNKELDICEQFAQAMEEVYDSSVKTPPVSLDHCSEEPEPWINKPWDPSCDGPTQPLPPDDMEVEDITDDEIDILEQLPCKRLRLVE